VFGIVSIGQDITARLAQEVKYLRLINMAKALIFGVNTVGHVNVWN
jgi:hypothetical protein